MGLDFRENNSGYLLVFQPKLEERAASVKSAETAALS